MNCKATGAFRKAARRHSSFLPMFALLFDCAAVQAIVAGGVTTQ
jgi:hypothetical protein